MDEVRYVEDLERELAGMLPPRSDPAAFAAWREVDRLQEWTERLARRAQMHAGRVSWLEGELRRERAQGSVLRDMEGVLRAGADALMQQRHAQINAVRAYALLADDELAVTIDSVREVRDRIQAERGADAAPTLDRALRKLHSLALPDSTVSEVAVRRD